MLGEHDGHWRFTIGQRRGLGVSSDAPLYVVERRAAANEVVVGGADDLPVSEIVVRDVADRGISAEVGPARTMETTSPCSSAIAPPPCPSPPSSRSRRTCHRPARAHAAGALLVRLAAPFAAPAPGQTAVFYRGDIVVGVGVIAGAPAASVRSARGARRRAPLSSEGGV